MVTINQSKPKAQASHKPKKPLSPVVMPFTIMVDDRERRGGWQFTNMFGGAKDRYRPLDVPTVERHLETGDYRVQEPQFGTCCVIERKSVSDCVGSLTGGHQRLRDEHERMAGIIDDGGQCHVIVEGSMLDVWRELEASGRGRLVVGIQASWPTKFAVHWHWAGNRHLAEQLALAIFREWWEGLA